MKAALLSLISCLLTIAVVGQCDAPIVENWTAPSEDDITVYFTSPPGAQSYTLEISGDYGSGDFIVNNPLVLSGAASPGLNTVNFDASVVVSSFNPTTPFPYYYTARLSVTCANGDESGINQFYVSPFSILNDPGIDLGNLFFKPLTPLPDGWGYTYDTYIAVPPVEYATEIDSISVFIDLGHTWNGDISIELVSPWGTAINLVEYPNGMFSRMGLSVLFKDGATQIDSGGIGMGPRGIYGPSDPLSAFQGQNPEGVWVVKVTDHLAIDDGMLFGVALVINSSPCTAALAGTAFYDLNGNNLQDNEEPGLANAAIYNSLDNQYFFANANGNFSDCSVAGSGVLSLENTPDYYTAADVAFTATEGDVLTGLDVAIQPIPGNNDLRIDLFALQPDRPGFPNTYMVKYSNVGTECMDDIDVQVDLDSLLQITGSDNGGVVFSAFHAELAISQLCPLETGTFSLSTILSDTVSIGVMLESVATVSPVVDDQNASDNVAVYTSIVVGSFDPNDKTVGNAVISPEFVSGGNSLKYMVRFQNTGTYYAERVLVVDTLDANLDPQSFVVTASSHDVEVTRNGNIFYFDYENIFLPDSNTNETDSHGYIRYEVQPYPGMADGETIYNTAHIFFDFNPPIVTNTTTTLMDFASGLDKFVFEASLYPNPASDFLTLKWLPQAKVQRLALLDITGKQIMEYTVSGAQTARLAIGHLPAGVYIIRFLGDAMVKPAVWVKD